MKIKINHKDQTITIKQGRKRVIYSGGWYTDFGLADVLEDFRQQATA